MGFSSINCVRNWCKTHLKVLQGKLQHVSEDIAEDLRLPLHQHIFIVERLDHLWFDLENTDQANCQVNMRFTTGTSKP